jgi:transcriptional regulator of NAD metabolism
MHIRSRRDVREYMERIHSGKSTLLKNVTSDYHYHTICAESEDILNVIESELDALGYLVEKKELSNHSKF